MILYEVNLAVDEAATEDYRNWLAEHIEKMLALPGFVNARWLEVLDPPDDGRTHWSVHYVLDDEAALERYLTEFAPALRGAGLARFDGQFTATRRVLRNHTD